MNKNKNTIRDHNCQFSKLYQAKTLDYGHKDEDTSSSLGGDLKDKE
jgi:hypothetical protein